MPNPMMNAFGAGGIGAMPSQAQGAPLAMPSQAFGGNRPPMSSPTTAIGMFNPAGRQLPPQAVANAQGKPFQQGGMFNPMAQAMVPQPPAPLAPNNGMPQGMMQNAAPQMNPQTLAFLQSLFARR